MDPQRRKERYHPQTNPEGAKRPEILLVYQIAKAFHEVDERTILRQREQYLDDLIRCEIVSSEIESATYERIRKGEYRSPEDTKADRKAIKQLYKGITEQALDELFDDD